MSFPRYPDYKDSGVEWLGEVPAHWEVSALKHEVRAWYSGGTPDTEDAESWAVEGDGYAWVSIADITKTPKIVETERRLSARGLGSKNLTLLQPGTILVSMYASVGKVAELLVPAAINQAILGLGPGPRLEPHFLKYWLQFIESHLQRFASSNTQDNLNAAKVRSLPLFLPTSECQADIVRFLDRETAKIDALVAEQERLIALLQEKRQAVITQAVTKGLDPAVPMKDSGVEWLGRIPQHWELRPLRRVSDALTVGIVVNPSTFSNDEGLPFVYGGDIREGAIDWLNARRITPEDSTLHSKTRLSAGDLLTVRVGAPGVTAVVPRECEGGNCASVMHVRRGAFNSAWLCFAMNSRVVRFQVEVVQYGAAQEQFNISHAADFLVPMPPRAEQDSIAASLDAISRKLEGLIESATTAIALLHERRAALITAAVTGQIDVRATASAH